MSNTSTWSREADLEILDVVSDACARVFFWPGRLLVLPVDAGIVWTPFDDRQPLLPGTVLAAPAAAGHVRIAAPAGARYRVVFEPPRGDAATSMHVQLPRLHAVADDLPVGALLATTFAALEGEAPSSVRMSPAVARVRAMLGEELAELVDLESLGSRVGIERCHLCRTFQRSTGLPPVRFRAQLRLARARLLLREGHDCVDVAHGLGFCDQSHFTRAFRSHYATTPGAYARAVRELPGFSRRSVASLRA